jgi:hypothetical protein
MNAPRLGPVFVFLSPLEVFAAMLAAASQSSTPIH